MYMLQGWQFKTGRGRGLSVCLSVRVFMGGSTQWDIGRFIALESQWSYSLKSMCICLLPFQKLSWMQVSGIMPSKRLSFETVSLSMAALHTCSHQPCKWQLLHLPSPKKKNYRTTSKMKWRRDDAGNPKTQREPCCKVWRLV